MPVVEISGIATYYETMGDGPPLLMLAPGGFDADSRKWSTLGVYQTIRLLDHLPENFTCILMDRRETGRSGGRVERLGWTDYAAHAAGLLDHLGIDKAHLMGGCMGCCPVTAFAVAWPERIRSIVLYWPVGGARYRINGHLRFARHLAFVDENGLEAVVALARSHDKGFGRDPRCGPWVSVIRNDAAFADHYAGMDMERYKLLVGRMARTLIDRDTAPGADPEDLMQLDIPALVIPGADAAHATSAARYLAECLAGAQYWDVPVDDQTAATAPAHILDFLTTAEAAVSR